VTTPRHALSAPAVALAVAIAALGCGSRQLADRSASSTDATTEVTPDQAPPSAPIPPDHRRESRRLGPPPARIIVTAGPLRDLAGEQLAAALRALVGQRQPGSTDLAFALAALDQLGIRFAVASSDDGPSLHDLAAERGAIAPATRPYLGDLLLFNRPNAGKSGSLIAVAVGYDSRGVIEFIYLDRDVVRRGFLSPSRPREKRDADGRVLNTFLRHSDTGDHRGSPALAGELLTARIRLDRLLDGPSRVAQPATHVDPPRVMPLAPGAVAELEDAWGLKPQGRKAARVRSSPAPP
jgi:hypothetical protein